jgi:hypothetical protein
MVSVRLGARPGRPGNIVDGVWISVAGPVQLAPMIPPSGDSTAGAGTTLAPATSVPVPAATPARHRGDVLAVVVLIVLPVLAFGLPALLGHSVLPGDDQTQNFPLRVLTGRLLREGHLPLLDPYIWSGAPLLSGWNAGAAYPLTWLFAVLPGTAAWALNLIATWAAAGLGMFWFLRALRLGSLASFLGALSFAFAGAMPAQLEHFGLIAGLSWIPLQLLAVLRLTAGGDRRSRLTWLCVLAAAFGMTMLAGEPRSIDDATVIVAVFAAWRIVAGGRPARPAVLWVAAGLALGICLGAVQWLPGLAAVDSSQRAAGSVALFNSGSLPPSWLLLLVVPDLLGGSGSLGQPGFFAHYNLAEVTSYAGLLPLVGAAALLGRLRLRRRPPEWLVWHVIALIGIVLALGGNTPAGHLLAHLPFYGGQRLQSRNICVLDLALAVLLAYWADDPFGARSREAGTDRGWRRALPSALGVVPALAAIVVVAAAFWDPAGLLRWLGAGGTSATVAASGRLGPELAPYAVLAAAAIGLVLFGRRLPPARRSRLIAGFVVADVLAFTLLAVVAVGSGLGTTRPAPRPAAAGPAAPPARPIADLGFHGRFALFDPGLLDAAQLVTLGAPDLNSITAVPSVQGYSSLVEGPYAAATGTHGAEGDGQDTLSPRAIADGTLARLGTKVLLTVRQYLLTAAGARGAAVPPGAGRRNVGAGQRGTWYLAGPLDVSRLEVPDSDAASDAASGTQIGLVTPSGATDWFRARAATHSVLAITPGRPTVAIAVTGRAGEQASPLGPPTIVTAGGQAFVANGQLQNALVPPGWGFAGRDGSFAVFTDRAARGPLTLQALSGGPAAGSSVRMISSTADEPTAAAVRSPRGVRVIRAVAAIPGWTATWQPDRGPPLTLVVRPAGIVQAVDVPPGRGVVTWSYAPPGLAGGLALSGAALVIVVLTGVWSRRRRGAAEAGPG